MADRFPSLEDFDSGGRLSVRTFCLAFLLTSLRAAQTDIQTATEAPSTDDFLAREKAILGDDAEQFASAEGGDDDLLGGGGATDNALGDSTFEAQFPDITSPAEVRRAMVIARVRCAIECRMLT